MQKNQQVKKKKKKKKKKTFYNTFNKFEKPLELIHTNVVRKLENSFFNNFKYSITFLDVFFQKTLGFSY